MSGSTPAHYTPGMRIRPTDLVDVFVYLVVLGVFIQLFPAVLSESFLIALLTAVLLKAVLEVVLLVKRRIVGRIRNGRERWIRVLNVLALILVLPGSKFVVLELVDWAFGDAASLGGFVPVTLLIVVLMLARGGVRKLFPETGAQPQE
ncbi:Uncharacterised protein [Acidipropionibacterium jensenii]|uniref:Uncharacterized protein n=2 Tax=Acidipropionibacterium jensenii TaxID=1749 RepID=A0A3S4WYT0_9ACTN|nr:Uncharacterised protein [Acidipropionibacterium jensenii]